MRLGQVTCRYNVAFMSGSLCVEEIKVLPAVTNSEIHPSPDSRQLLRDQVPVIICPNFAMEIRGKNIQSFRIAYDPLHLPPPAYFLDFLGHQTPSATILQMETSTGVQGADKSARQGNRNAKSWGESTVRLRSRPDR